MYRQFLDGKRGTTNLQPWQEKHLTYLRDFLLCQKFGWTPSELLQQPYDYIEQFEMILHVIGQIQQDRETKNKYHNK